MTNEEAIEKTLAIILANQKKILTSITNIEKVLKLGLVGSLLGKRQKAQVKDLLKEKIHIKESNFKVELTEVGK